ncbi:MAG: hypothetical protein QOE92_1973 [Chloroflexota bacterium]|nr:hypothetical protein [Chloroflexota bacterium]
MIADDVVFQRLDPAPGVPLEIETKRLRMRLPVASDAEPFAAITEDIEVMRYIRGAAQGPEAKHEWVARYIDGWRTRGFERWMLESRADGSFIGYCGLHYLDDRPGDIEVGYALVPAAWGRGYATEAAAAAVDWGFRALGLERIVAVAFPENRASQQVMKKLGMRYLRDGRWWGHDLVQYGITREEWEARHDG